jgi:intein-encoded DNA endonuclease-like protein
MNRILENVADVVWVILQDLPLASVDVGGASALIKPGEDFVTTAVRVVIEIVRRGPYLEKGSMIKNIAAMPAEEFVQGFIDAEKMVLLVKIDGDVTVYSKHQRNNFKKISTALEQSQWRLFGDSEIGWCNRLDGSPVATTAGVVLGGKNLDVDKPEQISKDLGPRAKADLRNKFWGQGGASPKGEPGRWDQAHAEEIVNKLLQ